MIVARDGRIRREQPLPIDEPGVKPASAVWISESTQPVFAIEVSLSLAAGVGTVGLPVNVGELRGASAESVVARPVMSACACE